MFKNRLAQLVYRTIFVALEFIGILNSLGMFYGGYFSADIFVYYTNLSNYLCFVIMIIVLVYTYRHLNNNELLGHNDKIVKIKFYATIIILVTFLVYNVLLTDNMFGEGWNSIGNLLFHIVCPLLFVFDFFLFDKHHSLKWYDTLLCTVLPLIYVVIILIRGAILPSDYSGTIYPYFFLDVNELGLGGVVVWVLILLVVFIAISFIFYLYDKITIEDKKIRFYIKEKKED